MTRHAWMKAVTHAHLFYSVETSCWSKLVAVIVLHAFLGSHVEPITVDCIDMSVPSGSKRMVKTYGCLTVAHMMRPSVVAEGWHFRRI